MQRFHFSASLLLALVCLAAGTSLLSAQEKAGTRAMRREARSATSQRSQPQGSGKLTVSCQPEEVVAATVIRYMIPKRAKVSVRVYDEAGREVAVLDNQRRHAGMHQVIFDRRDLPNGVYYCKVVAGGSEVTQRLLLVDMPQ